MGLCMSCHTGMIWERSKGRHYRPIPNMVTRTPPSEALYSAYCHLQVVLTQADQLTEEQIERVENASDAILEVLEEVEA